MSVKRNRFFAPNDVYKERLDICKSCDRYFKLTGTCLECGCFMRVKAKIAPMSCPNKLWLSTGEVLPVSQELPLDLIQEVKEIWPLMKNKRLDNHEIKAQVIELYNTIYGTGYSKGTNCSSCLRSIWEGLHKIIENEERKTE